ncbi:MAG TPA: hypothetical protein VGK32_12485 [Vicinamibacterales bacterium]
MRDIATTPSIGITIGRQSRLYHAFVTTAPAALDSPSTVTLYASMLSDLAGFAAADIDHTNGSGRSRARLVLVDAGELAWQRARCRGNHHILAPADPVLVGLTSLQHWLWQRLQTPVDPGIDGEEDPRTTAE